MNRSAHLLELVRDFGPVLTTIGGFIGVIVTLYWNARNTLNLEREKFNKALELESEKLLKERRNIAAALMAELSNLSQIFSRLVSSWEGQEQVMRYSLGSFENAGPIFNAVLPKISSLRSNTIAEVCAAYEQIRSLPDLCVAIDVAKQLDEKSPYFAIQPKPMAELLKTTNAALKKALESLSADMGQR